MAPQARVELAQERHQALAAPTDKEPERVQIYRDMALMISGKIGLAVYHAERMEKRRAGFKHIRRVVDQEAAYLRQMANEADPAIPTEESSSWSSEE